MEEEEEEGGGATEEEKKEMKRAELVVSRVPTSKVKVKAISQPEKYSRSPSGKIIQTREIRQNDWEN